MTMPQAPQGLAPAVAPAAPMPAAPMPVTITALDVPFLRLVGFFFKAALAALPALIAAALVIRLILALVFWAVGGWRYGFWPQPWGRI